MWLLFGALPPPPLHPSSYTPIAVAAPHDAGYDDDGSEVANDDDGLVPTPAASCLSPPPQFLPISAAFPIFSLSAAAFTSRCLRERAIQSQKHFSLLIHLINVCGISRCNENAQLRGGYAATATARATGEAGRVAQRGGKQ